MNLFEKMLLTSTEESTIRLRGQVSVPWSDFLLNPRRLRGSDFLMRWSQGQWSEGMLVAAVNSTGSFFALPYGPSGTAPDEDVRAFELYFERLEAAGLGKLKRPDLLIFRTKDRTDIEQAVLSVGGLGELPFQTEGHEVLSLLLANAVMAVECENSLWRTKKMPDFGKPLTPQRRLGGKAGLRKNAVLPTIIVKGEDLDPLRKWQHEHKDVEIHVWHAFYDAAWGIAFRSVEQLIADGFIQPSEQVFQAPGGATTRKAIYKVYYQYAYALGEVTGEPRLAAKFIDDKNGHILPYVHFDGGTMSLAPQGLDILSQCARRRFGDER